MYVVAVELVETGRDLSKKVETGRGTEHDLFLEDQCFWLKLLESQVWIVANQKVYGLCDFLKMKYKILQGREMFPSEEPFVQGRITIQKTYSLASLVYFGTGWD